MAGWWRLRVRAEQRLSREIEFHLAERIAELVADGQPPDTAALQARRELGPIDPILEACRDQRWWRGLDDLARDVRYALRTLGHAPIFALVAILTLTLGIGANAALFQVYEALMLRALPVQDAERLHIIRVRPGTPRNGNFNGRMPHLTSVQVDLLRRTDIGASGLAVWSTYSFNLAPAGEVRLAEVLFVSGDYFDVLSLQAPHGRLLGRDDDRPGCGTGAVVLSDAFWRREYGGRAGAIGESLRLEGKRFDIVGVAPPGFSGLEVGYAFDVAVPLCADASLRLRSMDSSRQNWWLAAAARLPEGQSLEARNAAVEALSPALFRETLPPEFRPELAEKFLAFRLAAIDASRGVSQLRGTFTSPLVSRTVMDIEPAASLRTRGMEEIIDSTLVVERLLTRLSLFFGGLALLLAGVGLYGVIAYDAARRQRDIGIRLALGSSRRDVVLTVVGQIGWLLGAGLLMGVAVSVPLARWVEGLLYGVTVRDLGTYAVAGVTLAVVGVAAAWVPAWRASRMNPTSALRST